MSGLIACVKGELRMKIVNDTLEVLVETWDDPGDYPSGAGSGPLPSYDYLAGMEGELVYELSHKEYKEYLDVIEKESLDFWMTEVSDYKLPDGIFSAKWQLDKVEEGENVLLTFSVIDVEADPNWKSEEPDFDPPDWD